MRVRYYYKDLPSKFIENLPNYGDSVTDTTSYHPDISNVGSRVESASHMTPVYAFPDGVDTGERLQYVDTRRLDITEVDAIQKQLSESVSRQIEKTKRKIKEAVDEKINKDVPVQTIDMTPARQSNS